MCRNGQDEADCNLLWATTCGFKCLAYKVVSIAYAVLFLLPGFSIIVFSLTLKYDIINEYENVRAFAVRTGVYQWNEKILLIDGT